MEYLNPFQNMKLGSLVLCLLASSTIFILFVLHSSNPFSSSTITATNKHESLSQGPPPLSSSSSSPGRSFGRGGSNGVRAVPPSSSVQNRSAGGAREGAGQCDLFVGKWVRDERGSIYTNESCKTLPDMKNCGRHGKGQGYVYWRWRPDGCELPVFDPVMFLSIARGKKLMFIGDSLARNQQESLLCLLSQAETPIDSYKDANDKHRTWYFPAHDFTLMVVWTEFLVESSEIIINGTASNTFTINLDRMSPAWAEKLPELDYAVINSGNWFTRRTYVHQQGKLIGCVHCWGDDTIPSISFPSAIRMVFRAALGHISKCGGLLTVVRTYSMSHFEHGSWLTGGYCNRTQPLSEGDLSKSHEAWEFRRTQMEELERVIRGGRNSSRFELMDVTKAMMLRADAHPGSHWISKVTSDCLHWCLPGPIDMWNELLLAILKKNVKKN